MDIIQAFYDNLATKYELLFSNWESSSKEQAIIIKKILDSHGLGNKVKILDCACGIGTQAIGLAALGYDVIASDISENELKEAKRRCLQKNLKIEFKSADFRNLESAFSETFNAVIAMDNALPHMLNSADLEKAARSISERIKKGGIFIVSIRDYDEILKTKPLYSPPYIHEAKNGKRVSFQTWNWCGDSYKLTQYIIEDENKLSVSKFECEYRAVKRDELYTILIKNGFSEVKWLFNDESGYYQPIVVARK
jgi:ubiquinone/menaquinone biosynthesis C-methylase UbiE